MSLTELLPLIQSLPRSEKVRLIQLLAADVSGEEAIQSKLSPPSGSVQGDRSKAEKASPYPLRGAPLSYEDPPKPVAESDWEALK
jgi:hypothetical protein